MATHSLDERLRAGLTPELVARASGTTAAAVRQWSPAQQAQAQQRLLARVHAYVHTQLRLLSEVAEGYGLPLDGELGWAIEQGWVPATAAGALIALWTSPEGQLVQAVLARAVGVLGGEG